ncbi:putative E3 ubiquitin-protein ligase herc4 [Balamuthia mandrillaris]
MRMEDPSFASRRKRAEEERRMMAAERESQSQIDELLENDVDESEEEGSESHAPPRATVALGAEGRASSSDALSLRPSSSADHSSSTPSPLSLSSPAASTAASSSKPRRLTRSSSPSSSSSSSSTTTPSSSTPSSLSSSSSSFLLNNLSKPFEPFFSLLPNELLLHVCSFLSLSEFCALSEVNKQLRELMQEDSLWNNLLWRYFAPVMAYHAGNMLLISDNYQNDAHFHAHSQQQQHQQHAEKRRGNAESEEEGHHTGMVEGLTTTKKRTRADSSLAAVVRAKRNNSMRGVHPGLAKQTFVHFVTNKVYTWGDDRDGRLGLGRRFYERQDDTSSPCPVNSLDQEIIGYASCGPAHTAVITVNGDLYTFGHGLCGVLGHGNENDYAVPTKVETLAEENIVNVSCGRFHTVAVNDQGAAYIMGNDGHMRGGSLDKHTFPKLLDDESLHNARCVSASCGFYHSVVLTEGGRVFSWGYGGHGRLGHNDTKSQPEPTLIRSLLSVKITTVACGMAHTCAIDDKGRLYTWGEGKDHVLGHGDEKDQVSPTIVQALKNETMAGVSAGYTTTAAVTSDGKAYWWGTMRSEYEDDVTIVEKVPRTDVALATKYVLQVACYEHGVLGLTDEGTVYNWTVRKKRASRRRTSSSRRTSNNANTSTSPTTEQKSKQQTQTQQLKKDKGRKEETTTTDDTENSGNNKSVASASKNVEEESEATATTTTTNTSSVGSGNGQEEEEEEEEEGNEEQKSKKPRKRRTYSTEFYRTLSDGVKRWMEALGGKVELKTNHNKERDRKEKEKNARTGPMQQQGGGSGPDKRRGLVKRESHSSGLSVTSSAHSSSTPEPSAEREKDKEKEVLERKADNYRVSPRLVESLLDKRVVFLSCGAKHFLALGSEFF